jgi:glycyl-tRNA synthetase beta chain
MVYEFPELQGLMGGYYAEKSGESAAVATAIREHYLPTQQGTPIPSTRAGQIVALADKLDTVVAIHAVGLGPTASKDPFALKRAALAATRICVEGTIEIDLEQAVVFAYEQLPPAVQLRDKSAATQSTLSLVSDRFFNALELSGVSVHAIEAVRSKQDELDHNNMPAFDFSDLHRRISVIAQFQGTEAAAKLSAAHKRARNILKQAGDTGTCDVNPKMLVHNAEKALFAKIAELKLAGEHSSYAEKLAGLATLREPVDLFFENVMVNDKDEAVRGNRLALLRELDTVCREVADLSCLPG